MDVQANGLRFHVVDEGAGRPVILLHGFPDTSALWRPQIGALVAAGFRAIAPDMRGRGRTDRPAEVAQYALPVERLLAGPPPLPPVAAPTLGVFGARDLYVTEDRMLSSARSVTGPWRYERFDDAGHWVPLEQPDRLNRLLLEFLGA